MKRSDLDKAKDIEKLALLYLDARDKRRDITHSSGGLDLRAVIVAKGRRPETIGYRADNMRGAYISQEMLKAYRIVSSLDDIEYNCAIVWLLIKNRDNPETGLEYRLSDLLVCLSVVTRTEFTREMWLETRKEARRKMAEKAQYIWPEEEDDTTYSKTA